MAAVKYFHNSLLNEYLRSMWYMWWNTAVLVCNCKNIDCVWFSVTHKACFSWCALYVHCCTTVLYLSFLMYRKRNRDLTHFPPFQTFHMNVLIFTWTKFIVRISRGGCIFFLQKREADSNTYRSTSNHNPTAGVQSERFERFDSWVSLGFPPDMR